MVMLVYLFKELCYSILPIMCIFVLEGNVNLLEWFDFHFVFSVYSEPPSRHNFLVISVAEEENFECLTSPHPRLPSSGSRANSS